MRKRHKKKLIQQGRCSTCKRRGTVTKYGKEYCWHCGKELPHAMPMLPKYTKG